MKAKHTEKALELLQEKHRCLQPDVIMYNSAFGACQEAMQSDKVSELLAEIKQLP